MKRLHLRFLLLFFLCAGMELTSCNAQIQPQPKQPNTPSTDPQETARQIKRVENSLAGQVKIEGHPGDNILDRMAFHKVKGLSIAVIQDYKIAWAKGYGWADENTKQPVTENTLFQAASISKSINAMGVLKLAQDGKLDLHKDINHYLTSWKYPYDAVANGKKITALNLLTHTGGVSDGAPSYAIGKDSIPTLVEALNGAKESKFTYSNVTPAHSVMEPGVQFQYSNNGIGITQLIVGDITGKPYAQYIQETIFQPIGMGRSCYEEASLKQFEGHVATGYSNGYEVPGKHTVTPLLAAGGLWTTPTDLAQWIIEIQKAKEGKSEKVLRKETIKTMLTPYIEAAPGFFILEKRPGGMKYFTHSGAKRGFAGEYYGSFEGGYGVVVLINSDGQAGSIIQEVINSVATVYEWKDFYSPQILKPAVPVSDELIAKCEGVYVYEDNYYVILKAADGGHVWSDRLDTKMHFTAEQEFVNPPTQSSKRLMMDAQGNVTAIQRFVGNVEYPTAHRVTDPSNTNLTALQLVDIGWHLLENKRWEVAAQYFERTLALNPTDIMSKCNLAHCYLFAGDHEKAIKLYRTNLDKDIDANLTFKQTILDDFTFFKRNTFDKQPMERVLTELKLPFPEAFQSE